MVGGGIGGIGRMYRGANRFGKGAMQAAGVLGLAGGIGAMQIGAATAEAVAAHQNNFGATGDLALGLHSMRHG
jgi:hypothetical protein